MAAALSGVSGRRSTGVLEKFMNIEADELYNSSEEGAQPNADGQQAEEQQAQATEQQVDGQQAQEQATDSQETGAEASPPEDGQTQQSGTQVPIQALLDERERRQRAEQDRQRLEQQSQDNQEKLDLFEKPEEFMNHFGQQIYAASQQRFIGLSESLARERYSDYDEKLSVFMSEIAPGSPAVVQQVQAAADPAGQLYQITSQYMQLKGVGNVDELREKIREEESAKLKVEQGKEQKDEQQKLDDIPESLSETPSAGGPSEVFNPPTQEQIYN